MLCWPLTFWGHQKQLSTFSTEPFIYHTCDVNVYLAKPREEAACDQKNFIPKQAETFHFMNICGSSA